MQKKLKTFNSLGVKIVAFSFEPHDRIKYYKKAQKLRVDMYCDPSKHIYDAFGLSEAKTSSFFHPKTILKYSKLLLTGYKMEKSKADVHQLGGDVITDASGKIRYVYRSTRPDDRPSIDTLLREVRKL